MIDDETLIAFVDGELDPDRRAEVERAIAADDLLRVRLERQRRLRERIASYYAPVAEEALPERLVALLVPPGGEAPNLVELAARRRPVWRELAALAATLLLGLFGGYWLTREAPGPIGLEGGQMVARGPLADALETRLASDPSGEAAARIGLSFAAADGRLCRTFSAEAMSGLACRGDSGWRIEVAAPAEGAQGEFRQAGIGSPLVIEAAQAMMAGEPFDAAAERRARDSGWRAAPD